MSDDALQVELVRIATLYWAAQATAAQPHPPNWFLMALLEAATVSSAMTPDELKDCAEALVRLGNR